MSVPGRMSPAEKHDTGRRAAVERPPDRVPTTQAHDTGDEDRRLRLLRRVAEDLSAQGDVTKVVNTVAELVTEATGADVCFVHLVDPDRRHITLAGATPPFDELAGTVELPLGEGVAGWVALNGNAAVVGDKWTDPRYRYIPELKGEEFSSLVSVPMLRRGSTVVGVLNVHWRETRAVGGSEVELLADVANLMAGAVENSILYRRLADREAMLAGLASRTIEAQEAERRRLAAEIHDGVGQRLASLSYHLDAARAANPADPAEVASELDRAMALARAAFADVRAAIEGLRPVVLDDLGLCAGLESMARSLPGLRADVSVDSGPLPPHLETTLFRIAQEALQNVQRHSRAATVVLSLQQLDGQVVLRVVDDGVGMPEQSPGPGHYGLVGIRERAELVGGTVEMFSKPGEGTRLSVRLPFRAG